ncbi:MAG: hypothetical protein IIV43_08380, partial [Oscillospiraceae bacterium]|nr:hypothetical protein [Oscillospiraceae bacterium]
MVHQYKLNGFNIVLDTCSGSVHVVDEVAYDMIELYKEKSADEIVAEMMAKYGHREDVTEEELRLCLEDIAALEKAGKLYTEDTFADMAGTFKERSGDVVHDQAESERNRSGKIQPAAGYAGEWKQPEKAGDRREGRRRV